MDSIPVVEVGKLVQKVGNEDTQTSFEDWLNSAKLVGDALHKIGFVYLANHGIEKKLIDSAFEQSKSFFKQPLDEKLQYKRNNATRGYHGGYFTNSTDLEESSSSLRIKNEQNEDSIFELRESYDFTGTQKTSELVTEFYESIYELQSACKNIVRIVTKLLGLALELEDPDHFVNSCKWLTDSKVPSFKTFRTLFYPAIPEAIEIPEGKFRVKEHSDFDLFTILFQDSVGGLEVKSRAGEWIPAPPVPDSIIINIGDMLERWTGGFYPATKHRVRIPKSEIKKRIPRQSIVYFVHTDSNVIVEPLKSPVLGDYTFESFKAFEYPKMKLAAISSY